MVVSVIAKSVEDIDSAQHHHNWPRKITKFYGMEGRVREFVEHPPTRGGSQMDFASSKRPNRVTAIFKNAALTFDVARETTLAQLAEKLCMLGEMHGGSPLLIDVRVTAGRRS
jgi:hypothetical protein